MVRGVFVILLIISVFIRSWFVIIDKNKYKKNQRVKITAVIDNLKYINVKGIEIVIPQSKKVELGDQIQTIGKLEDKVINGQIVGLSLNIESIDITAHPNDLYHAIEVIRSKTIANLQSWLPSDEGALAAGILVGGSEELSAKTKKAFQRTGVTHIIAASGYNVMVVAGWVIIIGTRYLGRRLTTPLAIGSVILYVFLAGASAAVVRAGIMASASVCGAMWGRKSEGMWLLWLTACLMVIWNPEYIQDVGFLLSVSAMAGVLWAGKSASLLKTTLAAQVFTWPIITHYFGSWSLVAPVTNLLILGAVPPVMQLAAIASAAGLIWPVAGQLVSFLMWPLLAYMISMIKWWSGMPWASWQIGQIGWESVLGYYLILAICLKFWPWRS